MPEHYIEGVSVTPLLYTRATEDYFATSRTSESFYHSIETPRGSDDPLITKAQITAATLKAVAGIADAGSKIAINPKDRTTLSNLSDNLEGAATALDGATDLASINSIKDWVSEALEFGFDNLSDFGLKFFISTLTAATLGVADGPMPFAEGTVFIASWATMSYYINRIDTDVLANKITEALFNYGEAVVNFRSEVQHIADHNDRALQALMSSSEDWIAEGAPGSSGLRLMGTWSPASTRRIENFRRQ